MALMNLFSGSNVETENRPMDTVGGEEGEGEMCGEKEIYNTVCKTDNWWEFTAWFRDLEQGLCNRLKGGMVRERGGRSGNEGIWVYLWLILVDVWQKPTKCYKALILQLKVFKKDTTTEVLEAILPSLWERQGLIEQPKQILKCWSWWINQLYNCVSSNLSKWDNLIL